MNKVLSTIMLCVFLCVGVVGCSGSGGCTAEEASAKAQKISAKMQEIAMNNPQKLQEITKRWQEISQQIVGKNAEEACSVYDQFLAEL